MNPTNRLETILDDIVNGKETTLEPVNRLEAYLKLISQNRTDGGTGGGGVSSWNDLTDKPFGELIAGEYTTWLEDCYATGNGREAYIYGSGGYVPSKSMYELIGKNVRVTLNGDVYESVCYISPNGRITVEAGEYIIGHMVTDLEPWIKPTVEGQRYDIKIEVAEVYETKLPIEYIPDELYTEIDNRINAVIEEALGGEY